MLLTALLLGLSSSLHCLGMCGPIVFSAHGLSSKSPFSALVYHIGRIFTYFCLGLLAGGLSELLYLNQIQQIISIVTGLAMIAVAINYVLLEQNIMMKALSPVSRWVTKLSPSFIKDTSIKGRFVMGMLNGLLPCGMVLLALIASISAGNVVVSGMYMVLFGLGTLPIFVVLELFKHKIKFQSNRYLKYAIGILGVLFVLRGLELGIPYISPQIEVESSCCHKPEE